MPTITEANAVADGEDAKDDPLSGEWTVRRSTLCVTLQHDPNTVDHHQFFQAARQAVLANI